MKKYFFYSWDDLEVEAEEVEEVEEVEVEVDRFFLLEPRRMGRKRRFFLCCTTTLFAGKCINITEDILSTSRGG